MLRSVASLLLLAILATSVISAALSQHAQALTALTFTDRATITSDSTTQFRKVVHDTGATSIRFLDVTGNGAVTQDNYNTSTYATSSFSNPIPSALVKQLPSSMTASSTQGSNAASNTIDNTISTYWQTANVHTDGEPLGTVTPTSQYRFNSNANDSVGANNLTENGTPTYATTSPNIAGKYTILNGSSQYFTASANTVFDVTTNDFSYWGFIYRTSDSGGVEQIIRKLNSTGAGYQTRISAADKLFSEVYDGTGDVTVTSTASIAVNTWYFFAVSADRDGSLVQYLYNMSSGAYETASAALSSAALTLTNTQTFTVGRSSVGASAFFPGRMDHLNVLLGTAISATQVMSLIQSYYATGEQSSLSSTLSPTSQYYFGGNGNDAVASNNLSGQGTPTYAVTQPNVFGQYTTLNGSTQFFNATANTVFDVTTGDFSLSGYIYRTSDSGGIERIVRKDDGAAGYSVNIAANDTLQGLLKTGATSTTINTTVTVSTNTWYFWAFSADRDGNGTIYIYNMSTGAYEAVSGSIVARAGSLTNTQTFTVGRSSSGSTEYFPGRMDHLTVFMGTALTADQVTSLYSAYIYGNMGAPKTISTVRIYQDAPFERPAKIDLYVSNATTFSEASRKTFTMPTYLEEAFWRFDSNTIDSSGYNRPLTPFATPTYAAGIVNNAVVLNGSTQYLQASGSTILDQTTTSFATTGYFYRTTDSGGQETLIQKGGGGAATYRVLIDASDRLFCSIGDGVNSADATVTTTLSLNTWYGFAMSIDRTAQTNTCYLLNTSGAVINSASSSTSAVGSLTNANTLTIGRSSSGSSAWFAGRIDGVHVYSRALTLPNIQDALRVSSGWYDLTLNTPIVGQYVKAQVNTWQPSIAWTVNEFATQTVSTTPADVHVSDIETTNSFYSIGNNSTLGINAIHGRTLYTDSLAGWYEFENTPNDSSGNGRTLTLFNSPDYVTGKLGRAMSFNGNNQYAQASANTIYDVTIEDFTLNGWLYRNADTGGTETIVSKAATNGYYVVITSGDKLQAGIINSGTASVTSSTSIATGTWYSFTAVYDRDGNLTLYINGAQDGTPTSIASKSSTITNTNIFTIGRNSAASNEYFPGIVDSPRIFTRTLSATEVSNLYNSNLGPRYLESSLVPKGLTQSTSKLYQPLLNTTGDGTLKLGAIPKDYGTTDIYDRLQAYWTFNGNANDSSGLGYTLTPNGAPTYATGMRNQAVSLNGSSDFFTASSASVLDQGTNDLTISSWIYLTTIAADDEIISKRSAGGSNTDAGFEVYHNVGTIGARINDGTATVITATSAASAIAVNKWYHVVVVFDRDATATIYINGAVSGTPVSISAQQGSLSNSARTLNVGRATGGSALFNGSIDQLQVWQRTFSSAEVKALYYGEYPLYTGTAGVPIANQAMHSVVVGDGASETVYTFFASNATHVRAAKFATATQTATLLSTAMIADASTSNFQVIPLSGVILVALDKKLYELDTGTDTITEQFTDVAHENAGGGTVPANVLHWLTLPHQPFTISASARTYVNTNLVRLSSQYEAYEYTPTTGAGPTARAVWIETLDTTTNASGSNVGLPLVYQKTGYYYLSGPSVVIGHDSGSTTWTVKSKTTGSTLTMDAKHEFHQTVQSDPFGPYEGVHYPYCGARNWNMTLPMMEVSEYADCTQFHTYEDPDITVNPIPRVLFPFGATNSPVHAFDFTRYNLLVTSDNATNYYVSAKFEGTPIDMQYFDSAGTGALSLLFGNCYDLEYTRISDSAVVQTNQICANDDTTKDQILSSVLGFPFWSQPWGILHNYNGTSHILTTTVRHNPQPYDYTVKIWNSTEYLIVNSTLTSNDEIDIQNWNMTAFRILDGDGHCTSCPFRLAVYSDDNKKKYDVYFEDVPGYLAPVAALFTAWEFEGWNILFFMPIVFAAMFTRNTAGIGAIATATFIAVTNWLGLITLAPLVVGLIAVVAVLGYIAYKRAYD